MTRILTALFALSIFATPVLAHAADAAAGDKPAKTEKKKAKKSAKKAEKKAEKKEEKK